MPTKKPWLEHPNWLWGVKPYKNERKRDEWQDRAFQLRWNKNLARRALPIWIEREHGPESLATYLSLPEEHKQVEIENFMEGQGVNPHALGREDVDAGWNITLPVVQSALKRDGTDPALFSQWKEALGESIVSTMPITSGRGGPPVPYVKGAHGDGMYYLPKRKRYKSYRKKFYV